MKRPSKKKSVLTEYNKLFKRKAEVELQHTWVEDSDDEEADICGSDAEKEVPGAAQDHDNSYHSSRSKAKVPEP